MPEDHSPSGAQVSRRRFLRGGALLAAGGLGAAACSYVGPGISGSIGPSGSLTYWNLLGGGDGVRMQTMQAAFQKAHPGVDLRATTLTWGNPYYTKLAMATVGGDPPDVAIMHLTRLAQLVPPGLLQPITQDDLASHGMGADDFVPLAWEKAHWQGQLYAIPLDTHPYVLYYNTDVAKKAGLLRPDGTITPLTSPDALMDAVKRAKQVTGQWGLSLSIVADYATPWRLFYTLYSQLGGQLLSGGGGAVVLDEGKARTVLELMRRLTVDEGLAPGNVDYGGAVALFASGKAGFYWEGDWEVTTFQTSKLPFDMQPFPTVFGGTATQADSHALVIPKVTPRDDGRTDRALTFIRSLLDQSYTWAQGGHVPAWLPTGRSAQYQKLKPQSNYASVADHVVYDPSAWYSGSGSDMESSIGSALGAMLGGQLGLDQTLAQMRRTFKRLAAAPSPV